jgi:hypothetical protein
MKIRIFLILLSAFSFQLLVDDAEAAPVVSAQELLGSPEKYDGKVVIYKGEAIGDIMGRGDYAWINVRDESKAIGIFCPRDLVGDIKFTGGYKFRGDMVSVRGAFHRFCPEHGGDTDIHAEKIIVIGKGELIAHLIEPEKVKTSITLAAIAFVLAIIHLVARKFRWPRKDKER